MIYYKINTVKRYTWYRKVPFLFLLFHGRAPSSMTLHLLYVDISVDVLKLRLLRTY